MKQQGRKDRVAIFVFCIAISLFSPEVAWAQPVTDYRTSSIAEVLESLSSRFEVAFAFDYGALSQRSVTVNYQAENLNQALDELGKASNLQFRFVGEGRYLVTDMQVEARIVTSIREPFSLTGKIVDQESETPVPYAAVRWLAMRQGVNCGADGTFQLSAPGLDTATLLITCLGYDPVSVNISSFSRNTHLDIKLTARERNLGEIVITEAQARVFEIADGGSKILLSTKQLELISGLGNPDPLRAIQWIPGVSGGGRDGAGLFIRGGAADQSLVQWDGITIYRPDHFFGLFGVLNPQAVGRMEVYRSGFGARYGGRASAVIDAIGKSGERDRPHVSAGVNLLQANASFEAPILGKNGSILITGRRAFSDWYQTGLYGKLFQRSLEGTTIGDEIQGIKQDSLPYQTSPVFQFGDLNARISLNVGTRGALVGSFFASSDRLTYNLASTQTLPTRLLIRDDLRTNNKGYSLTYQTGLGTNWTYQAQAAVAQSGIQYNSFWQVTDSSRTISTTTLQDGLLKEHTFRSQLEGTWNNNNSLTTGVEATHLSVETRAQTGRLVWLDGLKTGALAAVFAENETRWGNNLSVTTGYRATYFAPTQTIYHDPRLSAWYTPARGLMVKAAFGRYHQFVNNQRNPNQLQLSEDFWTLSGPDRQVVGATHATLGVAYEKQGWLVDVEGYLKHFTGVTSYLPIDLPSSFPVPTYWRTLNGGQSLARGVDVLIQKKAGTWSGWVSYSLAKVDLSFDSLLSGLWFPATYDIRHELKTTQMLTLGKWDFSALWFIGSGGRYTAPSGYVAARSQDSIETYQLIYGAPNAERLPVRHRLDITASYRFTPKSENWSGKAGVSLYNVYNRSNIQGRSFYLIEPTSKRDDPQIIYSDQRAPGFAPNVFIQFRF